MRNKQQWPAEQLQQAAAVSAGANNCKSFFFISALNQYDAIAPQLRNSPSLESGAAQTDASLKLTVGGGGGR